MLLAAPAFASDLTISGKDTSPVQTDAASGGTAGNITITSGGSVEVSQTGPAVLLNSNNTISNSGTISNSFGNGAVGITVVPGYVGSVTNSGTINVITTGTSPTTTSQYGILLMNPNTVTFTGTAATNSASLTASDVIGVISQGELVSGATGFNTGTYIASQTSGTPGGNGVYVLNQSTTAAITSEALSATGSNFVGTGSGNTLTVTSVTGLIQPGNIVSGTGVPNGTTIVSQVSGTPGGVGVYTTNRATTAAGVTLFAYPQIAPFTGDIATVSGSSITVAGFGANGIGILSELNGNLLQGGTITAQGTTSSGILATAPITGAFVNTGTIQTEPPTGVIVANTTTILSPGWAAAFGGNVGGGILNAGPVSATDKTAVAALSTIGASSALIVAPTVASDVDNISIGLVSDTNAPGYSIINRGKITATGEQPGVSPITVQIGNSATDTSNLTTTLAGGIYNSGTISAVATSDSAVPLQLPPAAANATAMVIGVGATVPTLNNTATGTISATTTGSKGGTATAIVIEGTSQIQSTATSTLIGGSLQSLINAGTISASAVSSDQTITGLTAETIQDLGGALTSVNNSGTISATATVLNNGTQSTIAADLSANTTAVTFTNSGTVTGDVLFPNVANNTLTIEGAKASLSGAVRSTGLGTVNIAVSAAGTGGILHTPAIVNAGTLNVGSNGTLDLEVGNSTTVVSASGPVTFAAASHITVTPVAVLPTNTSIRLVHSDTSLTFANEAATTSTIQVPFLFEGNLTTDPNNLTLTLERKTVAQLGLTGSAAAVYEPAITASLRDTQLGAALSLLESSSAVTAALNALLPISPAADQAIAEQLSNPYTNGVGARQRSLLLGTPPDAGFNPWLEGSFDLANGSGTNSFDTHGAGVTAGVDFSDPANGHFGLALGIQQTNITDKAPTPATERGTWYMFSPYMGLKADNIFLNIQLNGGGASFEDTRTVTIGSVTRTANSSPSLTLASGAITGGYIWNTGFLTLMPQVSLNGLDLFSHNYTEQNGGAGVDLNVSSHSQDTVSVFAGIGAGTSFDLFEGRLVPQLLAGYGQALIGGSASSTTAAFAAIPISTFTLAGTAFARSQIVGGFTLDFISGGVTFGASYNAVSASHSLSQTARLTFSTQF
jgi:hypothetical protein